MENKQKILYIVTNSDLGGISKNKQKFYKILEFLICAVNKMVTVHNGISDISEELRKKDFSNDELKFVMISRFCPQKNPYTLINAEKECNTDGMNIKLDLYGYGKELQQIENICYKSIQYGGV